MLDFDKMTVAEHEEYKEMQRKAEAWDLHKKASSAFYNISDAYDECLEVSAYSNEPANIEWDVNSDKFIEKVEKILDDFERTD